MELDEAPPCGGIPLRALAAAHGDLMSRLCACCAQVVLAARESRLAAAVAAEPILAEELRGFEAWRDSLETVPTIKVGGRGLPVGKAAQLCTQLSGCHPVGNAAQLGSWVPPVGNAAQLGSGWPSSIPGECTCPAGVCWQHGRRLTLCTPPAFPSAPAFGRRYAARRRQYELQSWRRGSTSWGTG